MTGILNVFDRKLCYSSLVRLCVQEIDALVSKTDVMSCEKIDHVCIQIFDA